MFRATLWLTVATLAGLLLGFAREWLLVAAWGAGARSDGFLVALFIPEAVRMTLAAGLLSAAALPLYQQAKGADGARWISSQLVNLSGLGVLIAALAAVMPALWVGLIGPGLPAQAQYHAADSLRLLALTLPLFLLHALAMVVGQARERFFLAGMGSFVYNLPAVLVLLWQGKQVTEAMLSQAFVAGAVAMVLSMLPVLWGAGWRPWQWSLDTGSMRTLYTRLGPLLLSASASQGLVLLERVCASWLGEGAITLVNLARKLVNLPLVALMSLNQVLLSKMVSLANDPLARRKALKVGWGVTAALTVPAAAGMIGAAPVLVTWALPKEVAGGPLPGLLAWFAVVIVFGAWNALLARYAYAVGDTVTPLRCELAGSAVNAGVLLLVPWLGWGMTGIAWAALLGCLVTGYLLLRRYGLLNERWVWLLPPVASAALLMAGLYLHGLAAGFLQFALASAHSMLWLAVLMLWVKRIARD